MTKIHDFKELDNIIKFAIKSEQESITFYQRLLTNVISPAVISEINEMIKLEQEHKKLLESIDVEVFTESLVKEDIGIGIRDYLTEIKPHPDMTVEELLNIAIHREQNAMKLYNHLATFFEDEPKQLFLRLAKEEAEHEQFFERKLKFEKDRFRKILRMSKS